MPKNRKVAYKDPSPATELNYIPPIFPILPIVILKAMMFTYINERIACISCTKKSYLQTSLASQHRKEEKKIVNRTAHSYYYSQVVSSIHKSNY